MRPSKPPPPPPSAKGTKGARASRVAPPPPLPQSQAATERASDPARKAKPPGGKEWGIADELAYLEKELESIPPGDGRRAALIHIEASRLLEASGAVPARVEERLRKAADACPEMGEAHRRMRRHHRQRGRWADFISSLDAELAGEGLPGPRAALHMERGRVLRDCLARPEATEDFARATALAPHDASAVEAQRTTLAMAGDFAKLVDVLSSAAEGSAGTRAACLRREAALLADHVLGDQARASALYASVLADAPGDAIALAAAERYLPAAGRWLELAETSARRAGASPDPAVRRAAYLRAGRIAAGRAGDPVRAVEWLSAAASENPSDPDPVRALAGIRGRAGDWEAQVRHLERLEGIERSVDARSRVAVARAGILADRLSSRVSAIGALEEALGRDPACRDAIRSLDRLLAAEGRTAERADLLALDAERTADARERSMSLCRAGELCERDPAAVGKAIAAYSGALEALPSDRHAFEALRRLYESAGDWASTATMIERRLGVTRDDRERRTLLSRLAAVKEQRLGDPTGAMDALEKLRAMPASEVTVLWDLQRLYAAAGRWNDYSSALRAEAALENDASIAADLLWRAGMIAEARSGDRDTARATYLDAARLLDSHRASLEALARLAAEDGRWAEHLGLEDRAMQGLSPAEQADRLVATARIAAETMGEPDEAVARCRRALALVPGHATALAQLGSIHERRGEWTALASALEEEASREPDPATRAGKWTRLGELLEERIESNTAAAVAYRRALADDQASLPAIEGLERVLMRNQDWDGAAAACNAASSLLAPGPERSGWLRKLAAILAWKSSRSKEAQAVLSRMAEEDPDDPWAHRQAEIVALRTGDARTAVQALSRLAAVTREPDVAVAYHKEMASLVEARLREDPTPMLASALAAKPDDLETLSLLEQRAQDLASLVPILTRRMEVLADPTTRCLVLLRLAAALQATGEETIWPTVVEGAAGEMPTCLPAVRQARMAAEGTGDWQRVVTLLEAEGAPEVTARLSARVDALRMAAARSMEKLADPARARSALTRAFAVAPWDAGVMEDLASLLRSAGDWGALADFLGTHADACEEKLQPPVLLDRARILSDHLGLEEEAARCLGRLVALDPGNAEAFSRLADIRYRAGSWQGALEALSAVEKVSKRHELEWKRARSMRAEILASRLGKIREAEQVIRDGLSDAPEDRDLLWMLAGVLRASGDPAGVEDSLVRLMKNAAPDEAVRLWAERGRTSLARGDRNGAVSCLRKAADLSISSPGAAPAVEALAREMDPDDAIHGLKESLYHTDGGRLDTAAGPLRLALAGILIDSGRDAEGEARMAVDLMPQHAGAWLVLARSTRDAQEAHRSLLESVRLDPLRPDAYEAMKGLADRDQPRYSDLCRRAEHVISVMDSDGSMGQAMTMERPEGERKLQRSHMVAWMVHPAEPRAALELLAQAGPRIGVLYGQPDLGQLQPMPSANEIGRQVAVVARTFGVDRYDIQYSWQPTVTVDVILDERPTIVVGQSMASAPSGVLRFHLGRVFALLLSGGTMATRLSPEEIGGLVRALAGQHVQGQGDPVLVQEIGKALGWMAKRGMAAAARAVASTVEDLAGWRAAADLTANRGGLLACGDLASARSVLHSIAGIPLPSRGSQWEASRNVPGLGDLLAYFVSTEYASLRAQVI